MLQRRPDEKAQKSSSSRSPNDQPTGKSPSDQPAVGLSTPKVAVAIAQRPATQPPGTVEHKPVSMAPTARPTRATSVLDADTRKFDGEALKDIGLRESQNAFTVVGVVGCQGCGKSTVLNGLVEGELDPFTAAQDVLLEAQTMGIDAWITPQQVIFLDTTPVLHHGGQARDLAATAWLCQVCDIVLVVQDFMDIEVLKLVRAAEMLSGLERETHRAALAFVFNKLSRMELQPGHTDQAQAFLRSFFHHTVDPRASNRRAANHCQAFFLPCGGRDCLGVGLQSLQAFIAGFPQRETKMNTMEWANDAVAAWSRLEADPEGRVAGLV